MCPVLALGQMFEQNLTVEMMVARVSWMMTSSGILKYENPDRVAHTPCSLLIRENEPMGAMFKVM